jgi:hypothetical protein
MQSALRHLLHRLGASVGPVTSADGLLEHQGLGTGGQWYDGHWIEVNSRLHRLPGLHCSTRTLRSHC